MIRTFFPALLVAIGPLLGRITATLLVLLTTVWACLALWYQLPLSLFWKGAAGVVWTGLALATLTVIWRHAPPRRALRALLVYALVFAGLIFWWSTIVPSQTRDWADDVARQLTSRVDGNLVTLNNVRNFDWRSDTDYTPRWETREYDLALLRSVDVAVSYWSGPTIAHTLVSFGFDDHRFLTFSIEIRKERGESFSSIGGFFKEFETSLIAADEHDILRVRTNVRGEDVYLYRVRLPAEERRSLFLAYLGEAESLRRNASYYNTLTANCTTVVYELARRIVPRLPMDYRLLASGYLPDYLYDVGGLTPGHDLKALRAAGRITDRAIGADQQPGIDFSREIRRGVPGTPGGLPAL